jgi:serine/threonine-protein kinase
VIVDDSGHVKVTDFGIARAGASDMTETGSILGTAQYLSPEQAQGHAVSSSSDLYAIGVVLYEMLTGRVPFDAEQAVTIAIKHVSEAPTAPTAINPQIPPELEQVVMWAMNKNPADRPHDADQFITALEHAKAAIVSGEAGQRTAAMAAVSALAGAGAGAAAPPPTAVAGAPPAPVPVPIPPHGGYGPEDPRERGRRGLWWALAVLIALLLAGGGVAAYLLTRPKQVVVPGVVGEQIAIARAQLTNAGFSVHENPERNAHPSGYVFFQSPTGGVKADKGSTVTLTVSTGPGNVPVPTVVDEPLKNAENLIRQAHLKVGTVRHQSSQTLPSGTVISTSPAAGASVPPGTKVDITVSSGKPLVKVPDVTGQSQSSAKSALTGAGFQVQTTNQTSSTAKAGTVISQNPSGGTQLASGSTVSLVIAKAPPTATVPNVVNQSQQAATATLRGSGFKVAVSKQPSSTVPAGSVISQSPQASSSATKGSTVTIIVAKAPKKTPTTTNTTPTTTTTTTGHP